MAKVTCEDHSAALDLGFPSFKCDLDHRLYVFALPCCLNRDLGLPNRGGERNNSCVVGIVRVPGNSGVTGFCAMTLGSS